MLLDFCPTNLSRLIQKAVFVTNLTRIGQWLRSINYYFVEKRSKLVVGTRIAGLVALFIVPCLNLTVMAISLAQLSHGSSQRSRRATLNKQSVGCIQCRSCRRLSYRSPLFLFMSCFLQSFIGSRHRKLVTERRRKLVSARILYLGIVNGFYPLTTFRLSVLRACSCYETHCR